MCASAGSCSNSVVPLMALRPANARLVERFRSTLEPDGWVIEVKEPSPAVTRIRIRVTHPLSGDCSFAFPDDDADHSGFVDSCLAEREFEIIRARPTSSGHVTLMQRFRRAAQGNGWPPETLATVARVLRHEKLLTEVEAEWLEAAGPAWWREHQAAPRESWPEEALRNDDPSAPV